MKSETKRQEYLSEALKGHYDNSDEDRLSQIFSASFNSSGKLRHLIAAMVKGRRRKFEHARAKTQQQYSHGNRTSKLDILILSKRSTPLLVIENKIEAPLTRKQLLKYNAVGAIAKCRKVALVRHHFKFEQVAHWKIRHWSELYARISDELTHELKPLDRFLLGNLSKHLEELGMSRTSIIKKHELKSLARAMVAIRLPGKQVFRLSESDVFETLSSYMSMLDELVGMMREDGQISRWLGKTIRRAPWIGWWDFSEDKKDVWIGMEWKLKKPRKGITLFGTGIILDTSKKSVAVKTHLWSNNKGDNIELEFTGNLVFSEYAARSIRFWKRYLR